MTLGQRPPYYPKHDLNATNTVLPEDSLYQESGYPTGLPVPSGDHNGKLRSNALWTAYMDCNTIRNDDWLDNTVNTALTLTALTYNTGGNVLTTGATVATYGTYLVIGRRVEIDDALLNGVGAITQASPLIYPLATKPGRLWVYVDPGGAVRVESVGPAVADNPNLGDNEITLVGLQIDAGGVVTDGAVAPTTLPLPDYELRVVAPLVVDDLTVATLTAERIVSIGNSSFLASIEAQATAGASSLLVTGNGSTLTGQAAINCDGSTGRAAWLRASGTVPALYVTHTGTGDALFVSNTAGTGYAINAEGPSGGDIIQSTCDDGAAFRAVVTNAGVGLLAIGGPDPSSRCIFAVSGDSNADAAEVQTAVGASSSTAAVYAASFGNGIALHADSSGGAGYAAVFRPDTTSPTRAAVRFIPQDADPGATEQGALTFNSNRGPTGKLRVATSLWESAHSSDKGWVKNWGAAAAGGPIAGGSGNLSLAQITPEEIGDVLVTATGSLEYSLDTGVCTVALWDITAAVLIAIQTERGPDTDGAGVNIRSFAIRYPYTLPSTATRTFAVVITATTGTITYTNVVCSVEGVQ